MKGTKNKDLFALYHLIGQCPLPSRRKREINIGNVGLGNLSSRAWREQCGAVMQDGTISHALRMDVQQLKEELASLRPFFDTYSIEQLNIKD